ncbi:MAG TPA: hypothetical protein VGC96_10800 [Candidatus Elarobacter sp.]
MKRLIACLSLVAAATTAAVPSTDPHKTAAKPAAPKPVAKSAKKTVAKAAPKCKIAPADEYFGKLKLSILGIRNTIKDQGLKIDVDPARAPSTLGAISLTEDAIRDWEHKYPCDGWLPGTLYSLQHFYAKIHTDDGVKHVHATFAWLRHDYPKSRFVQIAKREDGEASAVPAGPPVAAIPGAPAVTSTQAPNVPPASGSATAPIPGQAGPTPVPGTAPQSVINAMGGSPSPAPHP